MSDITPADLAKFVHRVPDGAVIPARTEYAFAFDAASGPERVMVATADIHQGAPCAENPRWTTDRIEVSS